jgi:hypothetical protein
MQSGKGWRPGALRVERSLSAAVKALNPVMSMAHRPVVGTHREDVRIALCSWQNVGTVPQAEA